MDNNTLEKYILLIILTLHEPWLGQMRGSPGPFGKLHAVVHVKSTIMAQDGNRVKFSYIQKASII